MPNVTSASRHAVYIVKARDSLTQDNRKAARPPHRATSPCWEHNHTSQFLKHLIARQARSSVTPEHFKQNQKTVIAALKKKNKELVAGAIHQAST